LLTGIAGFLLGAVIGRRLATRGITAVNALEGRQLPALLLVLVLGLAGLVAYFRHEFPWLPTVPTLYAEALLVPALRVVVSLSLGLVIWLEWPGRRDPARRRSLVFGTVLLVVCLSIVVRQSLPLTNKLGPSAIVDGVVIQTTAFTCAPASIATLVRAVLGDTTMSERHAVRFAKTTMGGTTTLQEIRAMDALGLSPEFVTGLTVDSLVRRGVPALLHVNEPVAATTIRHAVALLEVDAAAQTVVVGNPLYGRQVRRFADLEGYWLGEAIFVGSVGGPAGG
jgi:hypothetical protein